MEACTEQWSARFKQRAVTECLTAGGVSPVEIDCRMWVFVVTNVLTWALCIGRQRNPGWGRKSHGYGFQGRGWIYRMDFVERGRTINGGVPYCNTPTQEGFGSTWRTFCCNLTTLGLTPREPPWRQLGRWISQSYRTLAVSPDLAPHDVHLSPENEGRPSWTPVGLEEVGRSVRTWMENRSAKFFRGGF